MKRTLKYLLLFNLFLTSCNSSQRKETSEISLDFVTTFEGKINDKYEILMKITCHNGNVDGNYFYTSIGANLKLSGQLDKDGNISMKEYNSNGDETGIFIGKMKNNNKIEGTWSKPNGDKKASFYLLASNTPYLNLTKESSDKKYSEISGRYEYNYEKSAGSVNIQYINGRKFKFDFVVGTATGCIGLLNGVALIDDNGIGNYIGKDCKSVTFSFKKDEIEVSENNCFSAHGAGCSFEHTYHRK